jgi:26S proteasome non-ATPase regulatory subunit 9
MKHTVIQLSWEKRLGGSFPSGATANQTFIPFTMAPSTKVCHLADDLSTLIASKSTIEGEIESQAAILRANNSTLDSPLIDGDGFPRADIDIWAIRHARVRIIRLRNDLSSLTDKIAMALECVHASQAASTDAEPPPPSLLPFAKVDSVAPNSPAQSAVCSNLIQSSIPCSNLVKGFTLR